MMNSRAAEVLDVRDKVVLTGDCAAGKAYSNNQSSQQGCFHLDFINLQENYLVNNRGTSAPIPLACSIGVENVSKVRRDA